VGLLETTPAAGLPSDSAERPEREPVDNVEPLRILLAEDNRVNQMLATAVLQRQGHQVTVVDNGRQAVKTWSEGTFDLLLMDVEMPEMDGLEATRAIRDRERRQGGHVPIIAMTAHAMRGDRERCLEAGMDEYLAKPIRARQVREKLAGIAPRKSSREPAAPPPPLQAVKLDWTEALKNVNGDRALLKQLIHAFSAQAHDTLAALRLAVQQQDKAAMRLQAHTLKGSTLFLGTTPVWHQSFRLEKIGAGQEQGDPKQVLAEVEAAVASLLETLQQYLDQEHMVMTTGDPPRHADAKPPGTSPPRPSSSSSP
jgi:CheY-like chemotaxis protein